MESLYYRPALWNLPVLCHKLFKIYLEFLGRADNCPLRPNDCYIHILILLILKINQELESDAWLVTFLVKDNVPLRSANLVAIF